MQSKDEYTSAYDDSSSLKRHSCRSVIIVLSSVASNDTRAVAIVEGCWLVLIAENGLIALSLTELLVHEPTTIAEG